MGIKSYAEIEKDLPTIVKAELANQDDVQRQIFAEEFGKKRKTSFHCYGFLVLFMAHRWYLGNPWMTVLQWLSVMCAGLGLIWVLIDLFLIPSMRRDRNSEIARALMVEQKIISGNGNNNNQQQQQPTIINVSNNQ